MVGSTHDLIQRYIYVFGVWEPNISRWIYDFLRRGDVVIDVGANVGWVSLLASSRVGNSGKVFAFEPVPSIIEKLTRNLTLNNTNNVTIVPKIASTNLGYGDIFRAGDSNLGMSATVSQTGYVAEGRVERVRVADAVDSSLWNRVRLIKIDTEGDEFNALRGLEPIIEYLPVDAAFLIELTPHQLELRGHCIQDVVEFLGARDFEPWKIPNEYDPSGYAVNRPNGLQPYNGIPHGDSQIDTVFLRRK